MALSTSTIVMALLTAVPLGLAIKDTVAGKSAYDLPSDEDHKGDYSVESMERELAQAEHDRRVEIEGAIEQLVPMTTEARLGLPGYEIGKNPVESSADRERLENAAHAMFFDTRHGDGTLKTATITFPQYRGGENICRLLSQRLEVAWGDPQRTYDDGVTLKHWATTKPMQRATFMDPESERCQLSIEEWVAVPDFITKTEASIVPLWAIGKPAGMLVDKLGDNAFSDETQIRWNALGVGLGIGGTELYARIVKGKIVTISAKFQMSEDSIGALAAHLVQDHGEPVQSDPAIWKKPRLSLAALDQLAGKYIIVAGEPLSSPLADAAEDE